MLLKEEDIYFGKQYQNKEEAIKNIGAIMVKKGYVTPEYVDSMLMRDKAVSVAIGNDLAIPHSEQEGFRFINKNGMVFVKLVQPLNWDGNSVRFIIGLALGGDSQIDTLQNIAIAFSDMTAVENLYNLGDDAQKIINFLEDEDD